jgi:hypothetical protein
LTALVLAQATSSQGSPAIESDSSCPSAEAVRQALVGLGPAEGWPTTTVSIATQEQSLLLSLGVHATNQRRLAVDADCAARASMAALVIAAWLSELPSEGVAAPLSSGPVLAVHAEPAKPGPAVGRQALPLYRREVGAGLVAETGSGLVPGVRLELLGLAGQGPFGWLVSVAMPAAREVATGPGKTTFRRTSVAAALLGRLTAGGLILSADAGAALAYTSAQGSGYEQDQADASLTYGLGAGLRAAVPWGRVRIWTDGRVLRWLYGQTVEVEGVASTSSLPDWDLQWAIGVGYAF